VKIGMTRAGWCANGNVYLCEDYKVIDGQFTDEIGDKHYAVYYIAQGWAEEVTVQDEKLRELMGRETPREKPAPVAKSSDLLVEKAVAYLKDHCSPGIQLKISAEHMLREVFGIVRKVETVEHVRWVNETAGEV